MTPSKLILTVHFATTTLLAFAVFSAIAGPGPGMSANDNAGRILNVTTGNIDTILASERLVVLDFSAEWCAPCQWLAPHVEALAKDHQTRVLAGKIDVDREPDLVQRFGVQGIPHLKFFRNGKAIDDVRGYISAEDIDRKLREHLGGPGTPVTSPDQN